MTEALPVGWELTLDGHPAALRWLVRKTVSASPRVLLVGETFRMEWDELQEHTSEQEREVEFGALLHLTTLAGLASLFLGLHANLRLSDMAYRRPDGGRILIVSMHESIRASATVDVELTVRGADGLSKQVVEDDPTSRLLALSKVDETIAKVLRLANADLQDWGDLYRLFEVLQHAAGGPEALSAMSAVSKSKLSLFTRTANSPDLVGDEARHGVQTRSAPITPMSMSEAVELLRRLARSWLTWRVF